MEKDGKLEFIDLHGNEWVAESDEYYNLENYYAQKLMSPGWETTVPSFTISGMQFSTISSDGPAGGVLGFYLVRDNQIRVVNTSHHRVESNTEYRVFVSEIISEQELLNQIK